MRHTTSAMVSGWLVSHQEFGAGARRVRRYPGGSRSKSMSRPASYWSIEGYAACVLIL